MGLSNLLSKYYLNIPEYYWLERRVMVLHFQYTIAEVADDHYYHTLVRHFGMGVALVLSDGEVDDEEVVVDEKYTYCSYFG